MGDNMKFSLELLPNEPIKNIIELIKIAENIGFENVWITDHYKNRDVFEVLALSVKPEQIVCFVLSPYVEYEKLAT